MINSNSKCFSSDLYPSIVIWAGFPVGSDSRESVCNAGDPGSIPGVGRSPGEGNGNPLQYSCLENPMDRGTWQLYTDHGVGKNQTLLSDWSTTIVIWGGNVTWWFREVGFLRHNSNKQINTIIKNNGGSKSIDEELLPWNYCEPATNMRVHT